MRAALTLALAAGLAAAGAWAEDRRDDVRLSVRVLGLRAAELQLAGVETPTGAYAAQVRLVTTGAARAIARVRFDAEAAGYRQGRLWQPARYAEDADTGRRQSAARLGFSDGTAQVLPGTDPADGAQRAARAAEGEALIPVLEGWTSGAVDPVTALYAALRDLAPDEDCTLDLRIFDGVRASRVRLTPAADGTCRGAYRRVGGYPPRDMAERAEFPLMLSYADRGDGWRRLERAEVTTLWGRAVLERE